MESPESPDCQQGELLFVEDRRPGNTSPVEKPNILVNQESDGFITLDNFEEQPECETSCNKATDINPSLLLEVNDETEPLDHPKDDLLFVIEDRKPLLTGQDTQSPRYKINESFLKMHDQTPPVKKSKFVNPCFNCGDSTHALRDCKEPRDHKQIAKSRREFQEAKGSPPVYKRYHVEESQKFGHMPPGKLSPELRKAMGLDARELPSHIYMMRRLGYPPGWLQEALVSHSGITMFDGQGNKVATPGEEMGEVVERGSLDKYDIQKIIRYPGFNIPPPPDTYDDSGYWQVPPLSQLQSVEVMLERLGGRVASGYKRKKLSLDTTSIEMNDSSQSTALLEMEYEETPEGVHLPEDHCKFVPPLPNSEPRPPSPPTELPTELPENDLDSQSQLSDSIDETSLMELEKQKKLLLAELNDVTPLCSTPDSKVGKVKSVDLGTPILKSVSPFARLPSAEKFSVNICDVINFENLPDSTGKYEKISGIIRKVRCKLSKINSEQ